MLLVDTSVWIDLLGKRPSFQLEPEHLLRLATCPPIIQEVLQGLKDGKAYLRVRESFLALPLVCSDVELDTYLHAANIYRTGRRLGYTIRSVIDCLVAAIAIESEIMVWHKDRDFTAIAKFTELRTTERYV